MSDTNDQLILISGLSGTGKSASLRNIEDQEHWWYFNTEAGKKLPFKNKFKSYRITDPMQVLEGFDVATNDPTCKGIIIDSITFLMDMFESQYVLNSSNTMIAWGQYNQFFKALMQDKVIKFNRPVIITAHVQDIIDDTTAEIKTQVPIKGALKGQGVEAYFSTVVGCKKVPVKELESYNSTLLEITEEERELGFKYVFQTRITKKTLGERIRSPMGLFDKSQTYMDNDCQKLLNYLINYYGENNE